MITENRLWPVEIMRQKPANPKVARLYDKCFQFFLLFNYCRLMLKCTCLCVCGCEWPKRIQRSPSTGWLLWTWDASCIRVSSAREGPSSFIPSPRRTSWKRSLECTQRSSSYNICPTFCFSTIQILKTFFIDLVFKEQ